MPPQSDLKVARFHLTDDCGLKCNYCPERRGIRGHHYPHIVADYEDIRRFVTECVGLGIMFAELTGGDPLRWPGLKRIMTLCREKLGLFTLLSVSCQGMMGSFPKLGRDWLTLPGLLRISAHHSPGKEAGLVKMVSASLAIASKFRPKGETQLGVILIPGEQGNLQQELLEPLLVQAERNSCFVHPSTVFGTWLAGTRDWCEELWANIKSREIDVLHWFAEQSIVLPESADKIAFRLNGGNNTDAPTCQAAKSVVTVKNKRLIVPCGLNPDLCMNITGSLEEALSSKHREDCLELSGTYDHCRGCTFGCGNVRDTLRGRAGVELQKAYCAM